MSMTNYRERLLRQQDTGGAGAPPATVPPAGTPFAQPPVAAPEPIPAPGTLPQLPVGVEPEDWQTQSRKLLEQQQEILKSAAEDRSRRQGVDKVLGQRVPALEKQIADLSAQVSTLLQQEPGSPPPQTTPPPSKPQPKSPEKDEQGDEMHSMFLEVKDENQELRAIMGRDRIIREMSQPGQPGEGLNLWAAADNIPLAPPTVTDGKVNDEAQRAEVKKFIDYVAQQRQETAQVAQQAIMQGATPGSQAPVSAPGQPGSEVDELQELWTRINDPAALDKMDQAEFDSLVSRQDELTAHMGQVTAGFRQPFPDLQRVIQQLQTQMAGVMAQSGYEGPPLPPPG